MRTRLAPLAALLLFSGAAHAADAPAATSYPQFMSLKSEGANGRRGPSASQPVLWIYQRVGTPLEVTGESGGWRRVRDPDGAEVWMQARFLDTRQTAMVRGTEDAPLRRTADPHSHVIAYLAPGVVGAVTGCENGFRRLAVGGRVGWVAEAALWGADAGCKPTS